MKKKVKILLTSVGVATGPNVISALRKANDLDCTIVGVDADNLAAGLYLCDKKYIVSPINDPTYFENILAICKKEQVEVIIPLLSREILLFKQKQKSFLKQNIAMLLPDRETIKLCEQKKKFIEFLHENSIPSPIQFEERELKKKHFPLFVKPVIGSSSRGAQNVNNFEELACAKKQIGEMVIQEYLDGPEFTIDALCDRKGKLIAAVARERLETKDGKAIKCRTVKDKTLLKQVGRLLKTIKIVGPMNIQCIKHKGVYKFTEINTRFAAGGLPLTVYAGVNLPELLIKMLIGDEVAGRKYDYQDNIYMSRYLTDVFFKSMTI